MDDLARTVEILERSPGVLRSLLLGLSGPWTNSNYGPDTWSARDVVGHLVTVERDNWMPRLRFILEHGEHRPFDPVPHNATAADGSDIALAELLAEFERLRTANLRDLAALNLVPADLDRTGTHPAFGRVTARQLLATWAVHDLHHLRQIGLAMAWQFRDQVGPWLAYLNTLQR